MKKTVFIQNTVNNYWAIAHSMPVDPEIELEFFVKKWGENMTNCSIVFIICM
jgi:hypothetical protein